MSARHRCTLAWFTALAILLASCATAGLVESVESLLRQGKELFEAKRYDEALAKFQEVIRREPTSWVAWLYAARVHVAKVQWAPAIDSGRKALELATDKGEATGLLAEALWGGGLESLQRGQYREAVDRFGGYLQLRTGDARGYLNLGRSHLGAGGFREALDALVRGLTEARDAGTRHELAQTLLDGGRRALAGSDFRSAVGFLGEYVRVNPTDVSALLDLGRAHWQAGQRVDALGVFRRVLELAPGNVEALRFLRGE
jgi:tetratricopeptide (TPR) repeat protein